MSDWFTMDQARIDAFAEATEDSQWIHVDPVRAAAGPFGTTIAHGFLTLSLLPAGLAQLLTVTDAELTINYGLGRVRFPAAVPVGSSVRVAAVLTEARERDGAVDVTVEVSVECDRQTKPVCAAQILLRYAYGDAG